MENILNYLSKETNSPRQWRKHSNSMRMSSLDWLSINYDSSMMDISDCGMYSY